jgi:hypothetical protein
MSCWGKGGGKYGGWKSIGRWNPPEAPIPAIPFPILSCKGKGRRGTTW